MEEVAVSIIIPVYNGETFLEECLNSVLSQSLSKIEVICIDDGSTDGSLSILQEFAAMDERVRILRQSNQGSGAARNLGLEAVRGEFVAFLDCDDFYPNSETLQRMYGCAKAVNCQIVGGYHVEVKGDVQAPNSTDPVYQKAMTLKSPEILCYRDIQCDWNYQAFLFRTELLRRNTLTFPDYLRGQDPPFFVRAMVAAEKFCLMPEITYCYRTGEKNIRWTPRKINDLLKSHIELLDISADHQLDMLHARVVSRLDGRYRNLIQDNISTDNLQLPCLVCLADQRANLAATDKNGVRQAKHTLVDSAVEKLAQIWNWRIASARLKPGADLPGVLIAQMEALENAWQELGQTDPAPIRWLIGKTLAALYSPEKIHLTRQTLYALIASGKVAPYTEQLSGESLEILQTVVPGFEFYEKFLRSRDDLNCRVVHQGTQPEQPDVTVVIPVYNVQAYLAECLDSVVNQKDVALEIICVDDGSTDGSPAILEDYARRYPNITVLRQNNGGLAAARNAGIQAARGRYIQYLDSDDAMQGNCYGDLVAQMDEDNLDALYFNAESFYESEELKTKYPYYLGAYSKNQTDSSVMTGVEYYIDNHDRGTFLATACLSLMRRMFVLENDLRFPVGIVHEDNLYSILAMLQASRVRHISLPLYKRRVREGSLSITSTEFRHVFGYYYTARELERWEQNHTETPEVIQQILQTAALNCYRQAINKMNAITDNSQRAYYLALPDAPYFYTSVYAIYQEKKKARKQKSKASAPKIKRDKKAGVWETTKKRMKLFLKRFISCIRRSR